MRKENKLLGGGYMRWLSLVIGLLLALFAGPALAEEKPYEISVSVGASMNDYGDEASRAAEYESRVDKDSTWYLSGEGRVQEGDLLLRFHGTYVDGDDQDYRLMFDWGRVFSLKSKYHRFYHRLDHDTLENLQAHSRGYLGGKNLNFTGINNPTFNTAGYPYVYHEDLNQGEHYGITRSEWKNSLIFRLPSLPGLTMGFKYRYETRKGFDQARTLSKCSGCHVVGMTKQIAEFTNEYVPYIEARLGKWSFRYSFLYRNFSSSSDVPTFLPLNASRPTLEGATLGGNTVGLALERRLLYDETLGEIPFARTPDSEKWMHSFKAKWEPVAEQVWNFGFVASQNKNKSSNDAEREDPVRPWLYGDFGEELEQEYWGVFGNWHWRINRAWSLTARIKFYDMDADDVSVNYVNVTGSTTNYPISEANPTTGFPDGHDVPGFDPEEFFTYTRESAYDEDGFLLSLDLNWRYSPKLIFRFGYELEYKDRENADSHDVTDDTTEHTLKIGATWRARPGLKLKGDYKFTYADNPYVHENAAYPGLVEDYNRSATWPNATNPYGSPSYWTESSIYELAVYGRRMRDLSALPEYTHELALKGSWVINTLANFDFYGRFRYAENTETEGYDWENKGFSGGANLNLALSNTLSANFGYNLFWNEYTASMCVSLYHG